VTIYLDTDGDTVPDSTDTDDDNDGIPDVDEINLGLDPKDASDAQGDLDDDGVDNLTEFNNGSNPLVDDIAPVLTAPIDIVTNAEGYLTGVDFGSVTAIDGRDGSIVAVADQQGPFVSGLHDITWTATDLAGNSISAIQTLTIYPLVTLDIDHQVVEGNSLQIPFILSGVAPAYPVTISYLVSGTSDSQDHDLSSGNLVIASGIEQDVSANIIDDAVGESKETLIITIDQAVNAALSTDVDQVFTIVADNIAPSVNLEVTQQAAVTRNIVKTNGLVTINAHVTDQNVGDSHTYDWSNTDNNLVDTDLNLETMTFDPSQMSPGIYFIGLTVTDTGGLSVQDSTSIKILATDIILSDIQDSDGDGLTDQEEGLGDTDSDGIPNYQDDLNQPANVLPLSTDRVMQTASGLTLILGQNAFGGNSSTATTTLNDIASYGGASSGVSINDELFTAHSEIIDFEIEGLSQPGDSASIIIPLSQAMPANAVYRKFIPLRGWDTLIEGNGYKIESTLMTNGACPDIGSTTYSNGLIEGNDCLRLTLVDGGEFDGDGQVDGRISDPGVIAVEKSLVTHAPEMSAIPAISITENEVLNLNNNDSELTQYVSDVDTDSAGIQFSINNASTIDARFGITIGMNGTDFLERTDNSIHANPEAGFSGTTQVQVQAKDSDGNLSNVVTFSFTINAIQNNDITESSGGGGGIINIWMLFILFFLGLFYTKISRIKQLRIPQ
jgi:hypothetical protein